jgi:hypothetical protein
MRIETACANSCTSSVVRCECGPAGRQAERHHVNLIGRDDETRCPGRNRPGDGAHGALERFVIGMERHVDGRHRAGAEIRDHPLVLRLDRIGGRGDRREVQIAMMKDEVR